MAEYGYQAPEYEQGQERPNKRPQKRCHAAKHICKLLVYFSHVNVKAHLLSPQSNHSGSQGQAETGKTNGFD